MNKSELLESIERSERDRLNGLSREKLEAEYSEWFEGANIDSMKRIDTGTLIDDLVDDYMQWRNMDSEKTLEGVLSGFKK